MIDPHWQVVDLDPVTWRNLGPLLEPQQYIAAAQPGEHGLFILHEQGHVLKVVDTQTGKAPTDIPAHVSDPQALARDLYIRGEWQRVHIIDRRHLAWVAQQAQATPRRDLASDGYYHLVYSLIWSKPDGYACEPPPARDWHGWTYNDVRRFINALPSPSSLALGVYTNDALSMGLILVCDQGLIRRVTTFEGLQWNVSHLGPTQQTLTTLCEALEARFAPPAAVLLCTDTAFAGWLAATDKQAYLEEAQSQGEAIWQMATVT